MIHKRIKHLREDSGLTQENMAEYLCISQNAYSLIEKGKTKIDVERLVKIAKKLNARLTDLVEEDGKRGIMNYDKDPVFVLEELLRLKDKQIQQLLYQNLLLLIQTEKNNSRK